jgi:hypothetical protein
MDNLQHQSGNRPVRKRGPQTTRAAQVGVQLIDHNSKDDMADGAAHRGLHLAHRKLLMRCALLPILKDKEH